MKNSPIARVMSYIALLSAIAALFQCVSQLNSFYLTIYACVATVVIAGILVFEYRLRSHEQQKGTE
jgi:predicted Co/Zn/Cd cation transporter (cation efflux family)